jgi:hypothetical protein
MIFPLERFSLTRRRFALARQAPGISPVEGESSFDDKVENRVTLLHA